MSFFSGIFSLIGLSIVTWMLYPIYTRLPAHYLSLRAKLLNSDRPGRGNPRNEKVFMAATLYDPSGELFINLLGEDNAFLSLYENDSDGKVALQALEKRVACTKSILYGGHVICITPPKLPFRVPRLATGLLNPLEKTTIHYDKNLYLNDVAFNPIDALELLFSTNVDDTVIAQYRAACAVDFINPFKFYDTYASRDSEGCSMGLPFLPWFSGSDSGQIRKDVLNGRETVLVRSCWGGMVAFEAQSFRGGTGQKTEIAGTRLPARFRALQDINLFWDAFKCCLIHRLSSIIHNIGNHLIGLPWYNPHREEVPGQNVEDTVFVTYDKGSGSFQTVERIARYDGFCGRQGLQVITPCREEGQKVWQTIPMPTLALA
ncbi:cryptococcal mannosyltransferase 1-domain-containing protein [Aspergillus pseudocaelatus]|uniref:Cryptococcal mannosyltransferase 1-domain-containing protein n=1 Tax=Aspergillus pseudocaelatus TaxID=1825620 RepID=A0ABQ6W7C0_9EURO|nr:cryptococcal mannosyltransferase 1-domain-containing protein [Aspergillus pseudocaelatus]